MPEERDDTVNESGFATTELAERLASPQGADFAKELGDKLGALEMRVRAEMKNGVPGGQLERYAQVADALASAAAVVIRAVDAKSRQGVPGSAPH